MNAMVLSENDLILGILKDMLSVCEGIVWEVASQITQVNHRITFSRKISFLCVRCIVCVYVSLEAVLQII